MPSQQTHQKNLANRSQSAFGRDDLNEAQFTKPDDMPLLFSQHQSNKLQIRRQLEMYQSAFGQNRQSSGVMTSQRTNIINTSERFGSLAHVSDDSSSLSRLRTDDRVQNLLNQAKNPNSMKLTFMDDGKKDDESYLDSSESGSFYDRNGSVSFVPSPNDYIAHDSTAAVINTRDTD